MAAETSPPVQDSAVAAVSFFFRHTSRNALTASVISSSNIASCPRQSDRRRGVGDDALAAAGKTELFPGGWLGRYPCCINSGEPCNVLADGITVRPNFGRFANNVQIEMGDHTAALLQAIERVGEETVGRCALPLRIAGRKMGAYISIRQRAEDRVDQRMQADIGIRMPGEGLRVPDTYP